MLAIFLGALDQTIIAVSMPAISAQFNDVGLLAWVISGYMAMTVATPIYGKLGDLYGRRRMISGTAIFTFASVFCAAPRAWSNWCWRGCCKASVPVAWSRSARRSSAILVLPRERGRYQGYFSSMHAPPPASPGRCWAGCSPSTCRGAGYSG